jgi:hypothetical protein
MWKKGRLPGDMIQNLAKELPAIIAGALTIEEGDIKVEVRESNPHDINLKDLEIAIWVNKYPERLARLDVRREKIVLAVDDFLRDYDHNPSGLDET